MNYIALIGHNTLLHACIEQLVCEQSCVTTQPANADSSTILKCLTSSKKSKEKAV